MGPWPTSKTEVGNYLVWYWGGTCKITSDASPSARRTTDRSSGREPVRRPRSGREPDGRDRVQPGAGPIPGNGQNSATLPFKNFQVSDVPSNFDYTFRAGLFAGDYCGNATGRSTRCSNGTGTTGTREGRRPLDRRTQRPGSGDPTSFEAGRNPICEQSDVFFDNLNGGPRRQDRDPTPWIVTPCPLGSTDKHDHGNHH